MTLSVRLRHHLPGFELDVAFEAPPGVTVLFGPSGSGKTTLINAVAGLLRPDEGHIAAGDWVLVDTATRRFLPPHRRRLGYVFQEGRLFPHMSVRQNLLYGRWFAPHGAPQEDFGRVVELLGIGHLLTRRPGALSGGEKQRVAIGRALLASPKLILADEPLAALDEARKAEILPYFERLRDEISIPILYVSHSVTEVARIATTVVALEQGKISAVGPVGKILGDAAVVGAVAASSILNATIIDHHDDGLTKLSCEGHTLYLPRLSAQPGTRVRIRIRAEDVMLSRALPEGLSALNVLPGHVSRIRSDTAPDAFVEIAIGSERLTALVTCRAVRNLGLVEGGTCHAVFKAASVTQMDVGAGILGTAK